jgi:hypothetical protein
VLTRARVCYTQPHIGKIAPIQLSQLQARYQRIPPEQAQRVWDWWFEHSLKCALPPAAPLLRHAYEPMQQLTPAPPRRALRRSACRHGVACKARRAGRPCSVGMRRSQEALITGAVLPVWACVQAARDTSAAAKNSRDLHVVRCTTDDGHSFLGVHVKKASSLRKIVKAVRALGGAAGGEDADMSEAEEEEEEEDESAAEEEEE